ncbi:hypothetical protein HHL17_09680 [Chitinophaga sp. G-6-1-13]|uniref:Uncharacterized protein n=1 Tax=Chitinophaga fulva TaxID=2728842 RepID=A0A848GID4_9BACT|nr:hypothetical protein [Chitinophaga fulva]NML37461.1 hypothetical protein [Chitinophaga fulva]
MKNILFVCWLIFYAATGSAQKIDRNGLKLIEYHFHVLDSIANETEGEIIFCPASVKFMEKVTGIDATTDGNYFGRLTCKKGDLDRWHKWYEKYKRKELSGCSSFQ